MSAAVLWFRQDLRLADLPALCAAHRDAQPLAPIYVRDDHAAGQWAPGGASRWWLHHSLRSLQGSIRQGGGALTLRAGDAAETLLAHCRLVGAKRVYCSRRYEPWAARQERAVHDALMAEGIELQRFPGALLHEPGQVLTQGGDPFKVFTPFWRACRRAPVSAPLPAPQVRWARVDAGDPLHEWALAPGAPNWAAGWEALWTPGEAGASARLSRFLERAIGEYAGRRDEPAVPATSRLSPHLHHGELSPRQVWAACEQLKIRRPECTASIDKFQAELGWREFSYHLLHFFPTLPEAPFKGSFARFPWRNNRALRRAWQRGRTGYPIVDAGMRELWQTGSMHNRVRMVVASFLCKHLLEHWRVGAQWFWDTLVDADLASNACSWQWVAGSGADAAPYFRIFNPVTQGEKFDQAGEYVRRWVPELAALPESFVHKPWTAPEAILATAGVTAGHSYPHPVVDHRAARQAALEAYQAVKGSSSPQYSSAPQ